MSNFNFGPLESVEFSLPGDASKKAVWQVSLQEDGTLMIYSVGRRSGTMLIEPRSSGSVRITSDRIEAERREA